MKVFGVSAFREAVARGLQMAQLAQKYMEQRPHWQIVSGAQLGILTFRYCPPGQSEAALQALNQAILDELVASQSAMMASTLLKGKLVLRMCVINPRTTQEDIAQTVRLLDQIAIQLLSKNRAECVRFHSHKQLEESNVPLAS